jgi:hypothetical protein
MTRPYRQGFRDAKDYCAKNRNMLNAYGRPRLLDAPEWLDYVAGYEAGEKARTVADFNRWQRYVGD